MVGIEARVQGVQQMRAVAIAGAFGVIAALTELVILGVRRFILDHTFLGVDEQILWMVPASYLLLFAAAGTGLAMGHRLAPRIIGARVIVFVPAFLATFSLLWLAHPRLTRLAILLLSLGITTQVVRWLAPKASSMGSSARKLVSSTAAATIVLCASVNLAGAISERWRDRSLPNAIRDAPNIVLIVLDTVRAISMGLYGYERPTTPNIDTFSSRGVVFENAFAPSPWTLPTHATLFTGRYPQELETAWRSPLGPSAPTLAEVLTLNGYTTGGFVANLWYTAAESGLARGFNRYEDFEITAPQILLSSSLGRFVLLNPMFRRAIGQRDTYTRKNAGVITAAAWSWIRSVHERPFFAFLNYADTHDPYLPPEGFAGRFHSGALARQQGQPGLISIQGAWHDRAFTAQEQFNVQARYDEALNYMDDRVGAFLDSLDSASLQRNTIVVIVSDHGEMFGEHGLYGHAHSLYNSLLHVPLIVAYPAKLGAGQRVDAFVSLRDVPRTILELAGIADSVIPGAALLGTQAGNYSTVGAVIEPFTRPIQAFPSTGGTLWSVLKDPYQYTWQEGGGGGTLHDLRRDPRQQVDLSSGGDSALLGPLRTDLERFRNRASKER